MTYKKIIIIVAMQQEYELMRHILQNTSEQNGTMQGTVGNHNVMLLQCGIGKVDAAVRTTESIASFRPDAIINSGVAGGLGKGINVGHVVIGTEYVYHDVWCGSGVWGQVQGFPERFVADKHLLAAAKAIQTEHVHFGLICTGDQFICNVAMIESIRAHFAEGLAVDMESCAIAQVCHMHQIPFLSLRVISDTPGMEHDNTAQYNDFWKVAPKTTFEILRQILGAL